VVPPPPLPDADDPEGCRHQVEERSTAGIRAKDTAAEADPPPKGKPRKPFVPHAPSKNRRPRPRHSWAELLRRVFLLDVLTCGHCGGPQKLLAAIFDQDAIQKILAHLGLPAQAPALAKARAPPDRYNVPAATPTWTRHGRGCAGSAGVPLLDSASLPALGTTFLLQIASLPNQPGALYLAFGVGFATWNGSGLPAELGAIGLPGCQLWIDPTVGAPLAHGGSSTALPIVIPNEPALAGHAVATQALVLDGASSNGVGSVTNAGILRLH
jgi:hypothetical protein